MPNDKPATLEEEHHEEPITPAPAPVPAPIVPEVIEPHKVDDPLEKVINLITNNHKEVTERLDKLEKGNGTNVQNERKQEQKPAEPVGPAEPVKSAEPVKPKRGKLRLFRTI